MATQMDGGKFGLVLPELTKARAELENGNPERRAIFEAAEQKSNALIEKVQKFLEKKEAVIVSGDNGFDVIASGADAKYCITFYGPPSLAKAMASAFPKNEVITADGIVVTPGLVSVPKQAKQKPGL